MIVGIDLGESEQISTGLCLLGEDIDKTLELKINSDIIKLIEQIKPDLVAINSPLSLPDEGNWRQSEYSLNEKKIRFTPPKGFLKMERKVMRGIALKEEFQRKGILVIEVSSNAFYTLTKIPLLNNYLELKRLLKLYGMDLQRKTYSQKELDAVSAAFTGRLFLEGKVEFFGDEKEGQIVVPKVR